MGNCCPNKEKRKSMYKSLPSRKGGGVWSKKSGDDGSGVMNAIAAELWPTLAGAILEGMKKEPIPMKPYEMHVVGGNIGHCPTISNVELLKSEEGSPVTFTCEVLYECQPELDFQLAAQKSGNAMTSFSSLFMPDVTVALHWVYFAAKMHIEVSMVTKICSVYFMGAPDVRWDLDVEVSKLEIPINVEDKVDAVLEKEMGKISEATPKVIDFGASKAQEAPKTPRASQRSRVSPVSPTTTKAKRRKSKVARPKEPHVFKTSKQKEEEAAIRKAEAEMVFPEEEAEKLRGEGKSEGEVKRAKRKYERRKKKEKREADRAAKKATRAKAKEERKAAKAAAKEEKRRRRQSGGQAPPVKRRWSFSGVGAGDASSSGGDGAAGSEWGPQRRWSWSFGSMALSPVKGGSGSSAMFSPNKRPEPIAEEDGVEGESLLLRGQENSSGSSSSVSALTPSTAAPSTNTSSSFTNASGSTRAPSSLSKKGDDAMSVSDSLVSAGIAKPEDKSGKKKKKKKKKKTFFSFSKSSKTTTKSLDGAILEGNEDEELASPRNQADDDPRLLGD